MRVTPRLMFEELLGSNGISGLRTKMLEKQELGHQTTLRVPNDTAHDLKGEVKGVSFEAGTVESLSESKLLS